MGLGDKVTNEVKAWGTAGIIIVIISLVFLKMKEANPSNMTCATGWALNTSSNVCYNITQTNETATIGALAQTADTFVTAFSEPKNWVAIAVIAIIGFGMLYYFHSKKTK